ncbi:MULTISPECIES: hypothetical protein [Rhodococcus]|uniref:Uncharacterized protein n=1 Tax=Rhodococcus opacus TaxID=37919 RepID=A0A076EQ77_RHOOP|nr:MULTISPECIES: hypothetical protein [Rhodococcus]AII08091.1 hypothetical protein EP51_27080 [Rhodococcus opacus]WAM12289.1 hypothetical protein OYT95_22860 [Rhodococcus sp. JS3073]
MPADSDTADAIESLKKLKLLRSQPNTTVCVNHDIDDWNRLRLNGRQVVQARHSTAGRGLGELRGR